MDSDEVSGEWLHGSDAKDDPVSGSARATAITDPDNPLP
jgi:hypothetical protein